MSRVEFVKKYTERIQHPTKFKKVEISLDLTNIGTYKDFENLRGPYLIDDVLGLAYVIAKHGNSIQKITGVSYKKSLTEASLDGTCLVRYIKEGKILYKPKNKYVSDFIQKTVHGARFLACNKRIVSNSFEDVVNSLEKFYGKDSEVSNILNTSNRLKLL